ncbi:MAG: hypothetical protein ACYDH4_11355 [Candidatus Cryosericum sp.]
MSKRARRSVHIVYSQYPGESRKAISGTFRDKASALRYIRALERAPYEDRPVARFSYGGTQQMAIAGARLTPASMRFYEQGFHKSLVRGSPIAMKHARALEKAARRARKTRTRGSR